MIVDQEAGRELREACPPTMELGIGLSGKPPYQPDIKLWRDRAEEARTQAEQMTDPVCYSMMVQIAET